MTLVASILAPAVTGIALALEPSQGPWPAAADLDGMPAPAAAHESFAVAAHDGDLWMLPKVGDSHAGGAAPSPAAHDPPRFDDVALSDVLRWMLAFAGLAAIGAVRNPRR